MSKSRITEFARLSRDVKRVEQPYGGYYRQGDPATIAELMSDLQLEF